MAQGGCPACEGTWRQPVAQGFWECTSEVVEVWEEFAPAGPHGEMVPVRRSSSRICGNRYHDTAGISPTVGLCRCRTTAIGLCAECDTPICGDHSALRAGRRLCAAHIAAYDQAERDQAERAREQAAEAARRKEDEEQGRFEAMPPPTAAQLAERIRSRAYPNLGLGRAFEMDAGYRIVDTTGRMLAEALAMIRPPKKYRALLPPRIRLFGASYREAKVTGWLMATDRPDGFSDSPVRYTPALFVSRAGETCETRSPSRVDLSFSIEELRPPDHLVRADVVRRLYSGTVRYSRRQP